MKNYHIYDEKDFINNYIYTKNDLGASYTESETIFKLWSPLASKVYVLLFDKGQKGKPFDKIKMTKGEFGVWIANVKQDLNGVYYQYQITNDGNTEITGDPYAKACGVNGERSMVLDLSTTNPINWENDKRPQTNLNDAIIYESHIRDLTNHASSNIENKGKYIGLTESGTKSSEGLATGIDHLQELGITHLQLLPIFDFGTIDENDLDTPQYNWGYDPINYNIPDGSYSINPLDGAVRIKEFKQLIQELHQHGISVVIDVVYNHTYRLNESIFHKVIPGYFHRSDDNGEFVKCSGRGNETASKREMVRKYIVDSVKYWAEEYHIDGFRFDGMVLHDIKTMNEVKTALNNIDPSIIVYGEGWIENDSPLHIFEQASKNNLSKMPGISVFSDDCRDGLRGHLIYKDAPGFINGGTGFEETVKYAVVGATHHEQIDYDKIVYTRKPITNRASQLINFVSSHENLTLFDKLVETTQGLDDRVKIKMHKLANAIVLTSQGVPFLHSGVEFVRTKHGDYHSYRSPDSINNINWHFKYDHKDVYDFHRGLISLRKEHPSFKLNEQELINKNLKFIESPINTVAYSINTLEDTWRDIVVVFNASTTEVKIDLPHYGLWNVVVDANNAGNDVLRSFTNNNVVVPELSAMILYSNEKVVNTVQVVNQKKKDINKTMKYAAAGVAGLLLLNRAMKKRRK